LQHYLSRQFQFGYFWPSCPWCFRMSRTQNGQDVTNQNTVVYYNPGSSNCYLCPSHTSTHPFPGLRPIGNTHGR
jgi:hypothetical protein